MEPEGSLSCLHGNVILCQINPAHILGLYLFKIHFNVFFLAKPLISQAVRTRVQ
jgi:hypothetical protein